MNRDELKRLIREKVEEHARLGQERAEYLARVEARMDSLINEITDLQSVAPKAPSTPRKNQKRGAKLPKPDTIGRRILEALHASGGHASHPQVARIVFGVAEPSPENIRSVRSMAAALKSRGLVLAGDRDGWTRLADTATEALSRALPVAGSAPLEALMTEGHPGH